MNLPDSVCVKEKVMLSLIKDSEHAQRCDSMVENLNKQINNKDQQIDNLMKQNKVLIDTINNKTVNLNLQATNLAIKDSKIKNQSKIIRTLYAVSIGLAAIIIFK